MYPSLRDSRGKPAVVTLNYKNYLRGLVPDSPTPLPAHRRAWGAGPTNFFNIV